MKLIYLLILTAVASQFSCLAAVVVVPGTANPWLAGLPDGSTAYGDPRFIPDTAPSHSPILAGTVTPGAKITLSATGGAGIGGQNPIAEGPEGYEELDSVVHIAENGIAAAPIVYNAGLMGVFLSDDLPTASATPGAFPYQPSATIISPGLKQPFFIGDGLTGRGSGQQQEFVVPAGATRLFLGVSDYCNWKDNVGSVIVDWVEQPGNNLPEAYDDSITTDQDTAVNINLFATDPDNDPLTYSIVDQPLNGTLTGTPPDVTYTPDPGFNGSDSFTFRANDGEDDGNIATVTLTIQQAPFTFDGFLPPVGGADATGGSFGSPLRTFKLGSTIPVKFTITLGGASVLTGVHRLEVIKYSDETTSGIPIDATPRDEATCGNEFRISDGQWKFNLDTQATGMSQGIWLLRAVLSDNTEHTAWIQLK